MSLFSSLKAMFAAKPVSAKHDDKCCDHDHADAAKADCADDCCKDGATCSTANCECKHDKAE